MKLVKRNRYKLLESGMRSFHCGSVVLNLTNIHEDVGLTPGSAQWVSIAVSCGVGHICSLDPALLCCGGS